MFLKFILKTVQSGSKFAQTSADISKRTMQTNFADYTRFAELLGNLKVSEKFKKNQKSLREVKISSFEKSQSTSKGKIKRKHFHGHWDNDMRI